MGQRNTLRKQPTFRDASTGLLSKGPLRNERRNSILMTCEYTHLGSTSDWTCREESLPQPIRITTPDLGSDTSSVQSFCVRFLDVISRANQWQRREMSAVFSGQYKIWTLDTYMHMCIETHGTLGRRLNRAYDVVLVNSNCLFKLQKKEFLSYDCFKFSHKLK